MLNRTSEVHINELPVEILWNVFQYCNEVTSGGDPDSGSAITLDSVQATNPIILSHVSKYWRSTALELRQLWSFIRVADDTPLEKTLEWLHRSRDSPLDILLFFHYDREKAQKVGNILLRYIGRWRQLHANVSPPALSLSFWDFVLGDGPNVSISLSKAPRLKVCEIEVNHLHYNSYQEHFNKKYLQITSPFLTTLIFKGMRFGFGRHFTSHFQMTYLDLALSDKEKCDAELWRGICQLTSLQHLRLGLCDLCMHGQPAPQLKHYLPQLLTLRVQTARPCPTLWKWLAFLDAPKLRSFHMWQQGNCSHPSWWFIGSLHASLVMLKPNVVPFPSLAEFSWVPDRDNPCQDCLKSLVPKVIHATKISVDIRHFQTLFPLKMTYPRLEEVLIRERDPDSKAQSRRTVILCMVAQANPNALVTFEDTPRLQLM